MKKLILALILILISVAVIILRGGTYEASVNMWDSDPEPEHYLIRIVKGEEFIRIDNIHAEGNELKYTVHAVAPGEVEVNIDGPKDDDYTFCEVNYFYVHKTGVVTADSWIGACTGGNSVLICFTVYIAFLCASAILKFRQGLKEDFYSYHNTVLLGMIVFMFVLVFGNTFYLVKDNYLIDSFYDILSTMNGLSTFMVPIALLVTIGVFISNVKLMIKEGVSRSNLMGTIACAGLCFVLIFPRILDEWLQRQNLLDVHRETGIGHLINMLLINCNCSVLSYISCILIATVIMGIRAAKRIPSFDKDYMLILGCRVRKDGTLTPLLKGRADAALKFARKQKEAGGPDITFVPSGGQGHDEVVSEASAIRSYLVESGVPKDRIIVEDKSTTTEENFKYSVAKIKESRKANGVSEDVEPKIAFATTRYHVFRAGFHASRLGMKVEGVGGKTKAYFMINAFIRELIATLYYERKLHIKTVAVILAAVCFMVGMVFLELLI